jgi:lysozyme
MIKGLDVSAYQGAVDWPAVAAMGCRFAIVKCSEGNKGTDPNLQLPAFDINTNRAMGASGQDPRFARNVAEAKSAGLAVGCYHFAYPLPPNPDQPLHDPESQAKFAFDLCGGLGSAVDELPPTLDFEWPDKAQWMKWGCTPEQLRKWALDYLAAASDFWGCTPWLYTYPSFWADVEGASEPAFAQYPLCMASYPNKVDWPVDGDKPFLPGPWKDWTCWQFTGGKLYVPTVGGNKLPADYDVMQSEEALQSFLVRTPSGPIV